MAYRISTHPGPRHLRALARRAAGAIGIGVVGLEVTSAPYSTDPRAFSPVGALVAVGAALVGAAVLLRLLRRARRRVRSASVVIIAMLAALFISTPASAASLLPVTVWHVVVDTAPVLVNPWAWRATTNIYPSQGLRGIAPIFFRPLVPGKPVTVFVVPGSSPNTFRPLAVATERQVVPLTSAATWNSIPPHSLPVNNIILLKGVPPNTAMPPASLNHVPLVRPGIMPPPALPNTTLLMWSRLGTLPPPALNNPALLMAGCAACRRQTQVDVNMDRLPWEVAKLATGTMIVPKTGRFFVVKDLLKFLEILPNPELAGVKLTKWGVEKIGGLVGWPNSVAPASALIEPALPPHAPARPSWLWRINQVLGGPLPMGGPDKIWTSHLRETYNGISPLDGWTSIRTTRVTTDPEPQLNLPVAPQHSTFKPSTVNPPRFNSPPLNLPRFNSPPLNLPHFNPNQLRFNSPPLNLPRFNSPPLNLPRFNSSPLNLPRFNPNQLRFNSSPLNLPRFNSSTFKSP
jgi:hypothetical protein